MTHRKPMTAVRIKVELRDRLAAEAADLGVSVIWLVDRLCREGLDHITPNFSLTRREAP